MRHCIFLTSCERHRCNTRHSQSAFTVYSSSHPVPAPQIRSHDVWRYINLHACMYACSNASCGAVTRSVCVNGSLYCRHVFCAVSTCLLNSTQQRITDEVSKAHDRRPKFSVQETSTRSSHEKLGPIYAHKTHKNLTRETWRLMIQTKTLWQSF